MVQLLRYLFLFLNLIRCLPHLVLFFLHKRKAVIQADTRFWLRIMKEYYNLPIKLALCSLPIGFIYLLAFYPEYRNLFYNRVGNYSYLLNIFCRKMSTLLVGTKDLGEGLFIQHGFATAIGAKSIGKNCVINQQVSIGGNVVIGDNVRIRSGAVIIGNFKIGSNCVIGANSTVLRDVPENSTVYPTSPKIMTWSKNNAGLSNFERNLLQE